MLSESLTIADFDRLEDANRPTTKPLWSPGIVHRYYPQADPDSGARDTQYTPRILLGGKGFSAPGQEVVDTYERPQDIPEALSLSLTDKTTRGIYEARPIVAKGSVFDRLENYEVNKNQLPLENATLINNPIVETFETVRIGQGNSLQANYEDTIAQASGQDPAGFVLNAIAEEQPVESVEPPEDESFLRVPGVFDLNKTVLKETGVFVVGAIILAIGIFALTR